MSTDETCQTGLALTGQRGRPARYQRAAPSKTLLLVLLAAALPAVGCGDADQPPDMSRKAVAIDQLPGDVIKAARKAVPGVDFNEAWQNLDRDKKLHSYEIRGRASNGKVREARVAPDGRILELE